MYKIIQMAFIYAVKAPMHHCSNIARIILHEKCHGVGLKTKNAF